MKTHYEIDKISDVNPMGMMHGGVHATLVDSVTSWACFVNDGGGRPTMGVTTDLSVSYLKGIDIKKHPVITLIGDGF